MLMNDRRPVTVPAACTGPKRRHAAWVAAAGLLALPLTVLATPSAFAATEPIKVVFQDNDNVLAGYSASGTSFTTTLGLMAGTNPSVAQLADGSYEAAFEANNDYLGFSHLGGGTLNTTLGMDSGTSPAIAALPGGGWVAAFQDNVNQLYLYDSSGHKINTGLGMAAGTSPALAVQPDGSYRVVFEANNDDLAGYNSSGSNYTTNSGMKAGTGPAIAALPDGTYEVAVEANTTDLTTVHLTSTWSINNTTLGMSAGTSPSVAAQTDGSFKVVFEANNDYLAGYNSSGTNYTTNAGMKAGTGPSIIPLPDGTYEVGVEANTANLTTVHLTSTWSINNTTLGMDAGTSPSLAVPYTTAATSVAGSIAALANANIGKGAGTCSQANSSLNSLGGSEFNTSCTGNGGSAEYWCADFALWVWANSGVNTTGLTAAAGSFVTAASQNGSTLESSSSYAPQVGDAVVYNYGIDGNGPGVASHVGLVTGVNADGSITTANGDFGGGSGGETAFAVTSTVQTATISASQKYVGNTPSSVGMTISYYVTPSGL
ncbi:CHAP domain-containing protein [Actinospica durhamensis]|uniref:CHAP domain-containing protein n=1 Tax=Actinospica durhamensis TaxID=1508375 RepID=A0A941ILH2_9ACTN|nr:CHAP domain-containing protein [Actinospica durhamensis]MBR7833010.1 CHAP domain-containing protein [Actinospica durhamensis]